MKRALTCLTAMGAIVASMAFAPQAAEAGWGSYGSYGSSGGSYGSGSYGGRSGWGSFGASYGGSSGGWGSSGGSYGSSGGWNGSSGGSSGGSHGSRRVGLLHRIFHHHRRHHVSHGSSGGWGSSGGYGSSGGWGSSGGYASSGGSSGGSWGGSAYYAPTEGSIQKVPMDGAYPMDTYPMDGEVPMDNGVAPDATAPPQPSDLPPQGDEPQARAGDALLNVSVPSTAKIFVNGRRTSSTGANRQYVSRGLNGGYSYTYEVRAEMDVNGQTVEETKTVTLRAGETAALAFDLRPRPETSLTLNVPADAKVSLGGNATEGEGDTRVFRTTTLKDGQQWSNYTVRVEVERDGETLVKEETIALKAGDAKTLSFDFAGERVASTR